LAVWHPACWVCETELEADARVVQAEKVSSEPGTEGPLGAVLFHDEHYPPDPEQGEWRPIYRGSLKAIPRMPGDDRQAADRSAL
jgi:hypothetical protein